jgi:hypothetical protein
VRHRRRLLGQRPEQTAQCRPQPARPGGRERVDDQRLLDCGGAPLGIGRDRAFRGSGRCRNCPCRRHRRGSGHRSGLNDRRRGRLGRCRRSRRRRRHVDRRRCVRRWSRRRRNSGRLNGRRRRSGRRLRWSRARRQQRQRVDVSMLLGRDPDPEVNVGRCRNAVAALADRAEGVAFADLCTLLDQRRLELQQRDRVPVAGSDRHRATAVRNAPNERDRPRRRGAHVAADVGGDVDPAVLAARVGIVAERERAQQRTVDRPAPSERSRSEHEREQGQGRDQTPHCHLRFR